MKTLNLRQVKWLVQVHKISSSAARTPICVRTIAASGVGGYWLAIEERNFTVDFMGFNELVLVFLNNKLEFLLQKILLKYTFLKKKHEVMQTKGEK